MDEARALRTRHDWLRRLVPAGEVDLDRAAPSGAVASAVAGLGQGPVGWALETSATVVRRICDEVPSLAVDADAVESLRRGNEATTLLALVDLAYRPAAASTVDDEAVEVFREFVHRAVPLGHVLHGVRVGHAATSEAFLLACGRLADPALAAQEVTAVARDLFRFVDGLSDLMVRTYLAEHEAWTASAAAARSDVVHRLLDDPGGQDPDDASRVLGYDLRFAHEAVLLWSDGRGGGPALQAAAAEVLRARGATSTLVVPVGAGRVWAWGTVPVAHAGRDDEHTDVEQALSAGRSYAAFGSRARGATGFRRSHEQAQAAAGVERLRREAGRPPVRATHYADVIDLVLLTTDLDAAGDFVRAQLRGLADRTPQMEALRTTLYHYLTAERSLAEVARRLHIARGTVTYRVGRAQEVLGHDTGRRRLALHNALLLAEELGDAVLRPPAAGRPDNRVRRP